MKQQMREQQREVCVQGLTCLCALQCLLCYLQHQLSLLHNLDLVYHRLSIFTTDGAGNLPTTHYSPPNHTQATTGTYPSASTVGLCVWHLCRTMLGYSVHSLGHEHTTHVAHHLPVVNRVHTHQTIGKKIHLFLRTAIQQDGKNGTMRRQRRTHLRIREASRFQVPDHRGSHFPNDTCGTKL